MSEGLFVAHMIGFAIGVAHLVHPPIGKKPLGHAIVGAVLLIMYISSRLASSEEGLRSAIGLQVITWVLIIVGVRLLEAFHARLMEAQAARALDQTRPFAG